VTGMEADLRLRRRSARTCVAYLRCVRAFAAYHRRSPAELGEPEVRAFLTHLVEEAPRVPVHAKRVRGGVALSLRESRSGRARGLRADSAPPHRPELARDPQPARSSDLIRTAWSGREIPWRSSWTAYRGGAPRERARHALEVSDIDSARLMLRIRAGKGGDETATSSRSGTTLCSGVLRAYWTRPTGPARHIASRHAARQPISTKAIWHMLRKVAVRLRPAIEPSSRQLSAIARLRLDLRYNVCVVGGDGRVQSPLDRARGPLGPAP